MSRLLFKILSLLPSAAVEVSITGIAGRSSKVTVTRQCSNVHRGNITLHRNADILMEKEQFANRKFH